MIWIGAFSVVAVVAALFYWLRGIGEAADRIAHLGFFLMAFCCLGVRSLDGTTALLNDVGLFVIALGVLTIVVGRLRQQISSERVDSLGLLLMAVGVLLALLL